MSEAQNISNWLKHRALDLGFSFVGIARAERLDVEAKRLEIWLNQGYQGKMAYLENHFEKRVDPRQLVPGAKSVISLVYNYYTSRQQTDNRAPKISQYAFGKDYHLVVKEKLQLLFEEIKEKSGDITGRCFVDSAPVMEREWAKRAGNGWVGKNTLIIHPKQGSYFFLAEIIVDLELQYDAPMQDYCGTCTRCIDACPTEAIAAEGYELDASKCISYLTIELKDAIPTEFAGKMENWMFGCDICQQVCPWNRFSISHLEPAFDPTEMLMEMDLDAWTQLNELTFQEVFRDSAVKRTKFNGLKRNIDFLSSENGPLAT